MNPLAVVAIIVFTPLVVGSIYQAFTAGLSPFHVLGLVGLVGIGAAIRRIRDDRREGYEG